MLPGKRVRRAAKAAILPSPVGKCADYLSQGGRWKISYLVGAQFVHLGLYRQAPENSAKVRSG